jgi:hypothetical protein
MEWVQQTTATTMLTELYLTCLPRQNKRWNQKAKNNKTKKNTNERMSLPP